MNFTLIGVRCNSHGKNKEKIILSGPVFPYFTCNHKILETFKCWGIFKFIIVLQILLKNMRKKKEEITLK